jgi:hypothetical protein
VSFNISHHGDWVILAGDTSLDSAVHLGVDVMDFKDQSPGESFETLIACFLDQVRVLFILIHAGKAKRSKKKEPRPGANEGGRDKKGVKKEGQPQQKHTNHCASFSLLFDTTFTHGQPWIIGTRDTC